MLSPVFSREGFGDFAEAGNGEPQNDETKKKTNKPELVLNRIKEHFLNEALDPQFRQPRFREDNKHTSVSDIVPGRIIVVLN